MVISPCGAVKLLAAIFNKDEHRLKVRYGLEKEQHCLNCGAVVPKYKTFCNTKCHWEYRHPLVECDWCHRQFRRKPSKIILYPSQEKKGSKGRVFCNRSCFGHWVAEHHGFAVYPEHQRKGCQFNKSKYSEETIETIWLYHQLFGWGAPRLSRLLRIPEGTITVRLKILHRTREEIE